MRPFLLLLAAVLAAAAERAVAAEAPLPPFHGEFEVRRNGETMGRATIALQRVDAATWEFRTSTRGTEGLAGLAGAEIDEHSRFRWQAGQPELLAYDYRQSLAWKRNERRLVIDTAGRVLRAEDDGRDAVLPLEPGLLDPHLAVLAVAADLAAGRTPGDYRVAHRLAIESQRYRAADEETVEVPAGRFAARRVERVREPGARRVTESWLAPALGWMPIRTLQREPDGETLELRLLRVY